MKDIGYIKLHRSMLQWGWYTDVPTRVVFDHLLLVVNWKPGVFLGLKVEPGSVVTSRSKLAKGSGLTEKQVRRALDNLESTGEIVVSRAGRGQLVTLTGWALYQSDDEAGAVSGPTKGRIRAGSGPDQGHYLRREESKKERIYTSLRSVSAKVSPKDRVEDFRAKCKAVVEADPKRLHVSLRAQFMDYWTEIGEAGKMRFEDEKFFDHGRRMDTWQRNAAKRGDITSAQATGTKPVWNPRM